VKGENAVSLAAAVGRQTKKSHEGKQITQEKKRNPWTKGGVVSLRKKVRGFVGGRGRGDTAQRDKSSSSIAGELKIFLLSDGTQQRSTQRREGGGDY